MLAIICFLPFLALIVTGIIKSNNNHKALPKYDVNYTRQKEMEIWGYYFTPAPEDAKAFDRSKALSAAAPIDQLNARVKELQNRDPKCHVCNVPVAIGADTCQACTLHVLQKRKQERLNEYKAKQMHRTLDTPRVRWVHGWSVLMPSEVPDHAYADTVYDAGTDMMKVYWKWTDKATGKTKGLMSLSSREMVRNIGEVYRNNPCDDRAAHELATCDCEEYVIKTGDGKVVKRYYA